MDYKLHNFSETLLNEELNKQLAIFKEQRATDSLLKIIAIDLHAIVDLSVKNRVIMLIGLSIHALMEISKGEQLPIIEKFISYGLENYNTQDYDPTTVRFAIIRHFTLNSMRFSNENKAIELLIKARGDPSAHIRALVFELLTDKFENN